MPDSFDMSTPLHILQESCLTIMDAGQARPGVGGPVHAGPRVLAGVGVVYVAPVTAA